MLHPSPDEFAAHPASPWTGAVKVRFLECLAQKGNVRLACAQVGLSAETAYRQRRRDPAFARGWAAATALARRVVAEVLTERAIDGIEEEVWYRGELLGTRRKFDSRLLLALLARLDREAEQSSGEAEADADQFDELLAMLAGEEVPEALADEDGLPLCREAVVEQAAAEARAAVLEQSPQDDWSEFGRKLTREELDAREQADHALEEACFEAMRAAEDRAHDEVDRWLESVHAAVDTALEDPAGEAPDISPRTLSTLSTPPADS